MALFRAANLTRAQRTTDQWRDDVKDVGSVTSLDFTPLPNVARIGYKYGNGVNWFMLVNWLKSQSYCRMDDSSESTKSEERETRWKAQSQQIH